MIWDHKSVFGFSPKIETPWTVVDSLLCSEKFFSEYSGFPSPQKPTFPNSNLTRNQARRRTTLCMCYLQIIIYLFIYLFNKVNSCSWCQCNAIYRRIKKCSINFTHAGKRFILSLWHRFFLNRSASLNEFCRVALWKEKRHSWQNENVFNLPNFRPKIVRNFDCFRKCQRGR